MDKVEAYINDIKKQTNTDKDVCLIIDELNDLIKSVLITRLNELKIHPEYQSWVNDIVENWRCPIKWKINSTPVASTIKNEKNEFLLKLDVQQQLLIFSSIKEIESNINSTINGIQKRCDSKHMLCNEKILLRKLHELYKNLPGEDGEDLKKIITKSFNVKYVKCEGEYESLDYFDSHESDVANSETRFEAMVSLLDDSCIEKGTYLYPQNIK